MGDDFALTLTLSVIATIVVFAYGASRFLKRMEKGSLQKLVDAPARAPGMNGMTMCSKHYNDDDYR